MLLQQKYLILQAVNLISSQFHFSFFLLHLLAQSSVFLFFFLNEERAILILLANLFDLGHFFLLVDADFLFFLFYFFSDSFDLLVNDIMSVIQILHWFLPLLHNSIEKLNQSLIFNLTQTVITNALSFLFLS